jgi:uncharacterized protein YneF (UPF0154 family)
MAYEILVLFSGFFPAYRLVGKWLRQIPPTPEDLVLLAAWILAAAGLGLFISVFFCRKGVKKLQDSI